MSEKGRECQTCGEDLVMCPGHFGFINLELPVFHVGFFKHVINILQSVCKECARILLNENERVKYIKLFKIRKDPIEREQIRKVVQDLCRKVKLCPHCGEYNGTIKKVVGQALKVVHDKYNPKTAPSEVIDDFIEEFEYAC